MAKFNFAQAGASVGVRFGGGAAGGATVWALNKIPFVDSLNPEMKGIGTAALFAIVPEFIPFKKKESLGKKAVDNFSAGAIGAAGFQYLQTKFPPAVSGIGNRDFRIEEDYMNNKMSGIGDDPAGTNMAGLGDNHSDVMMG